MSNRNDDLTDCKRALLGLTVVTNRLLHPLKPKELPWSETEHLIDEWIHSELDRQLLKEKLHNEDVTFAKTPHTRNRYEGLFVWIKIIFQRSNNIVQTFFSSVKL